MHFMMSLFLYSYRDEMLTGVGDTFGTCFGPLSRNRKFGYRLGKGETMEEILASTTEVAEGVETSKALVNLIRTKCKGYRLDLKFPILFGIASILEGTLTPEEGLKGIMSMPFIMENFDERYSPVTQVSDSSSLSRLADLAEEEAVHEEIPN